MSREKFFGGFEAKHDSFESILQQFLSLSKGQSLKLFIAENGNNSLLEL